MRNALAIFRFCRAARQRNERVILVTLTDIIGSSARAPGSHMAVSESGGSVGSFSGGCIEAAVVAEALAVLKRGQAELIRFGKGSRFIDIRLPCGGGMELLFSPDPPGSTVQAVISPLEERGGVTLRLGLGGTVRVATGLQSGWDKNEFLACHTPDLHLVIVGHGDETIAMAHLGAMFSSHIRVLSPDKQVLTQTALLGAKPVHLLTPASVSALTADAYSAIVFLFHDHEWEPALMLKALSTPAFFIGAMGSRATHQRRRQKLADLGAQNTEIDRIVGPVGIIPAVRDPDTLAISVLAQIAATLASAPT